WGPQSSDQQYGGEIACDCAGSIVKELVYPVAEPACSSELCSLKGRDSRTLRGPVQSPLCPYLRGNRLSRHCASRPVCPGQTEAGTNTLPSNSLRALRICE